MLGDADDLCALLRSCRDFDDKEDLPPRDIHCRAVLVANQLIAAVSAVETSFRSAWKLSGQNVGRREVSADVETWGNRAGFAS